MRSLPRYAVCGALALATVAAPVASAHSASPAEAQRAAARPYGSNHFGHWQVDRWALPDFDYTDDELTDPHALQPETESRAAQHQVGNDHITAMAYNDGYTELWSQDWYAQWANYLQPSSRHYGGGFGWLRVGDRIVSTSYLDHHKGQPFTRHFGVGYYRKQTATSGVTVQEDTVAPFGNDPLLLDDVKLTNNSLQPRRLAWTEYWDINPYDQAVHQSLGVERPTWNARLQTLTVGETGTDALVPHPPSMFAAALNHRGQQWDTSITRFFGAGTRGTPAEVSSDRLSRTLAAAHAPESAGDALTAFRAPVRLRPGQSVTLRYAYGLAEPREIHGLVSRYRAEPDAETRSERRWSRYLPRTSFGKGKRYAWVSREIKWDAYLLRSASEYEARSGEHTITQGGDYQYGLGANLGTRSWPHYELPMAYSDPAMARQIILYTTKLQPSSVPAAALLPYGTVPPYLRFDLGTSSDLDFWLLNAAAQYGLATRDLSFYRRVVPYYDGAGSDPLWQHLKVSFGHMETMRAADGLYLMGTTGDWNDFATELDEMTESTLVTAQLAYAYPELAELADRYGDPAFAGRLRAAGARDLAAVRAQWTGKGWYSRGLAGTVQVGKGVIFEEPQPWAILAGAPDRSQAKTLVANIHRYLDGRGAPGGPTKIGSTLVPGGADPGVTEHGPVALSGDLPVKLPSPYDNLPISSTLQGADEWPGGVWFDPNGWLTWALASLQGVVPGAVHDAWSEYLRNTLARHASVFPNAWDGTISIDDVCYGYYSATPARCGNGLSNAIEGQITEQPTWMVMDALNLAGITPTAAGYDITPHLPMKRFSVRFPRIGVTETPRLIKGYVRPVEGGAVVLRVRTPDGKLVTVRIQTRANRATQWRVPA
ncbi:MAG TPA: hypothetical protein VG650_00625 [Mycobacteriales bacterium]|nr:hypothetical protein [Mycobacteriales bacterium]